MTLNLGRFDRALRVVAALVLVTLALVLELPMLARVALVANALYLAGSSLVGTCLGYKLMGMSTCPVPRTHV